MVAMSFVKHSRVSIGLDVHQQVVQVCVMGAAGPGGLAPPLRRLVPCRAVRPCN